MIAPGKGPKTLTSHFDELRADYDMSRESRFVRRRTGLAPHGNAAADWHYRSEEQYYRDIEKARDVDRNDAVVGQTIDRAVANIVQDGFRLEPQTGVKSLDKELRQRWLEWSASPESVDVAGEFCFHDFEIHSCRAMLLDGDCVNSGLDDGTIQHFESHNIRTRTTQENTFLGVTKDPRTNRRMRYWVLQDPVDPRFGGVKESAIPLDVRNEAGTRTLFHVYRPRRMSQTRGVTSLAPIFSLTGMFDDIQFAKLVQQQVVSCFAIFRQQEYIPNLPTKAGGSEPDYGTSRIEVGAGGEREVTEIAPGMEYKGRPGEKLEGFSPNVPNAEFFDHAKLTLQMIGINLGMPLVMMLMDGSETNFSGYRGAVDEARKGFRVNQRHLMDRFHAPLYRWKVLQWVASDPALRAQYRRIGDTLLSHRWFPPAWPYIEPEKDARGDALRWQSGLASPRQIHGDRGEEWERVAAEIVEDHAVAITAAKKRAKQINDRHPGEVVHWRDLISLPMPNGIHMSMQDPGLVELKQTGEDESGGTTVDAK